MRLFKSLNKPVQLLMLSLFLFGLCGFHWWDPIAKWVEKGNKALETNDYETAEKAYENAIEKSPGDSRIHHNKGLLAYAEEHFDNAVDLFDLASRSEDPELKSRSLYNRGCAYLQSGDLEKAAESFIETLKIDPDDEDAKINLEMVLDVLSELPTPTPEMSDTEDESDSPDTTPTPDMEQTSDDDQEQKPDTDQEQSDSDIEDETTPTPEAEPAVDPDNEPTPTPTESPPETQEHPSEQATPTPEEEPQQDGIMSQVEAERLLDALEQDEMNILKKLHQLPPSDDRHIEKDW